MLKATLFAMTSFLLWSDVGVFCFDCFGFFSLAASSMDSEIQN